MRKTCSLAVHDYKLGGQRPQLRAHSVRRVRRQGHACRQRSEAGRAGPYTIGKGTGKYAGISGSGTAVATTTATLARMKDGKCDTSTTVTPVAGTEHATIKAVGKVHLPSRNRVVTTLAADTVRI
jgi:hypothetical protein